MHGAIPDDNVVVGVDEAVREANVALMGSRNEVGIDRVRF